MSAERYEIKECELDVLAIAGTDGTRYIDGEEIEARVIRQLRSDLAAVTAERDALRTENAALLAANRDSKLHFDALKGDYDEAAHFGRHFVRDDLHITPRGAIIRLGDKCTDLFVRLQKAEAQLAEYAEAPTIALVRTVPGTDYKFVSFSYRRVDLAQERTELIARPKVRK